MTPIVGMFGLALAFCAALTAAVVGLAAGWARRELPALRWSAVAVLVGCATAVGSLEWALVRHDFSVQFVATNGSRDTPLYYTVTSLWAAHDGSLLLWDLILAAYLTVLALRRRPGAAHLHGWAVGVVAAVAAFFTGLALFTSGVFDRVSPTPADGPGPTPLLADHPAMGVHPPLLYLGLVGLVLPFGYAVAAMVTGDTSRAWIDAVFGPLRVAWTALTAGIVLGAWWSYAVLGWGGYWSWDPVENSSLMPWLLATALVHSLMVQRRSGALAAWNTALAVLAFLLAAVGVVLTRSGAVASVHAFADSGVGVVLLAFLAAATAGVLALAAVRIGRSGSSPAPDERGSAGGVLTRGTALLLNNVVLVALTVTVLLGTLAPVVLQAIGGQRVSVGPPYFDRIAVPLAVLLLALMVVGPLVPWSGGDAARLLRRLALPVAAGALAAIGTRVWAGAGAATALAIGLATAVGVAALAQVGVETYRHHRRSRGLRSTGRWLLARRRVLGGRLAHLGLAVLAVGVAASSALSASSERALRTGDHLTVDGVTATLVAVDRDRTDRSMNTAAALRLTGDGVDGQVVRPGLRFFLGQQTTVAAPAISSSVRRDVYATVLSVRQDGDGAVVRLAVNPMVSWIWAGGLLMVVGALAGVRLPGRRRIGAREGAREDAPDDAVPDAVPA